MTGGKGGWLPLPGGGVSDLDDLTDVDLTTDTPSDGDTLTFDSASSLWVPASPSPGGGDGGDLVQLDQVTLGTAAATVTFSSIPATHKDLVISGRTRLSNGGTNHDLHMRVGNGTVDSGANYDWLIVYLSNSSSTGPTRSTGQTSGRVAQPAASGATTHHWSTIEIVVSDYASTGYPRPISGKSTDMNRLLFAHTAWSNTADAIDTLTLLNPSGGNLVAGSRFTLYGRGTA